MLQAAGSLFVVPCVLLKGGRQAGCAEENLFLDETDRKKTKTEVDV